jgi:hypothetical protein
MSSLSNFRQWARDDLAPALMDTFGQCCRILPMSKRPNFSTSADPKRAIVEIVGAFSWEDKVVGLDANGVSVLSREPRFIFPTEGLPYALKLGDRVQTSDLQGQLAEFEITAIKPDGLALTNVSVVMLNRQNPRG